MANRGRSGIGLAVDRYADLLKSGKHEESYTEQVWEELEAGRSRSGRFINRKKDGTLYTDETSISPISDEDGRIISFVEIKKAITRELDRQEQPDRTLREESVGRLAGVIAHDLNNNLSPVPGFTELLLDKGELSSADRSMLEHIHSAGIRSRDLVQKLMAFGRKQTLALTPMELNSLLMTFKPYLSRMIREDIAVVYRLAAGLPRISADVGQIDQVLFNLTANAQDAIAGKGLIRIETCLKKLPDEFISEGNLKDNSEYIEWSISETGSGIGEESQGLIFDPFLTTKGDGARRPSASETWTRENPSGG